MTRDEIRKMRGEEPRKFDALVGKAIGLKVVGEGWAYRSEGTWNVQSNQHNPTPDWDFLQPMYQAVSDDTCKEWETVALENHPRVGGVSVFALDVVPQYAADPSADYSVLKLVRETWSKAMQEHFCRRLPSLAEYEVGDISEVALEVACMRDEGVIPNQGVK